MLRKWESEVGPSTGSGTLEDSPSTGSGTLEVRRLSAGTCVICGKQNDGSPILSNQIQMGLFTK